MKKRYLSRDDIVGKQVIDSKAMIVGSVKDLSFNFDAKEIGLTITQKDGKEVDVASSDIGCVGDVILLKKTLQESGAPEEPKKIAPPSPAGLCAVCGFQNDQNAKFCIKCGAKLS
jgi:sporulation protein YlmC with PRC-barrel domain